MNEIKVFSPASVSNICCGFDVLGFAIQGLGDIISLRKTHEKGIYIKKISGFDIPTDIKKNTATVALNSFLNQLNYSDGFEISIEKNIKPGSGLGSSAACAAGSVFAANLLLGEPFTLNNLVEFAMSGELISSESAPADNVASALYGGIVLVDNFKKYHVINLPTPKHVFAVIHHPLISRSTSESRNQLPKEVLLKSASFQLTNIASFVHSLHTNNFDLMKRSLNAHLVQNQRENFYPYLKKIKRISNDLGSICCSISGSGPSIFSLVGDFDLAEKIKLEIDKEFIKMDIKFNSYLSPFGSRGVRVMEF